MFSSFRNKGEGFFIASDIMKKLCGVKDGLLAVRKLQGHVKRLNGLSQDLGRKSELIKRWDKMSLCHLNLVCLNPSFMITQDSSLECWKRCYIAKAERGSWSVALNLWRSGIVPMCLFGVYLFCILFLNGAKIKTRGKRGTPWDSVWSLVCLLFIMLEIRGCPCIARLL